MPDAPKLKPCPCCGSKNIIRRDCGYSTFNPTWCVCNVCSFTVGTGMMHRCDIEASSWNNGVEKVKLILGMTKREREILGFTSIYVSVKLKIKSARKGTPR